MLYRLAPKNAAGRLDPGALGYAGWLDWDVFGGNPVIIQHAGPLDDAARARLAAAAVAMFPDRGCCFLPASVVRVDVTWQDGEREGRYSYRIEPVDSYPAQLVGTGEIEGQRYAVRVVPRHGWGDGPPRPIICFAEDFPPFGDDDRMREAVGEMIRETLEIGRYIVARTDRTFARAVPVGMRAALRSARPVRNRREAAGRRG